MEVFAGAVAQTIFDRHSAVGVADAGEFQIGRTRAEVAERSELLGKALGLHRILGIHNRHAEFAFVIRIEAPSAEREVTSTL